MPWTGWVAVGLAVVTGGWMLFDGVHALTTGDFVTPGSGPYAGQLGPWSALVSGVGADPRSTLVKLVFVGYGVAYLAAAAGLATTVPAGWWAMLIVAALGLWYLPFGTIANAAVIVLLLLPGLRTA